ncbi:BnaC07g48160D [Brassica napus]|uniref:BnaC07g48160D protein n=1 Tax=Brassica napus TaxID=3708 RepID=A0A078J3A9_BRANA|nr:BnaC07g48160D [Brassica napus]
MKKMSNLPKDLRVELFI